MNIDVAIEAPWSEAIDWAALTRSSAAVAAQAAPELGNARLTASVVFTDDTELRGLNREWRGKDKPTNVLSFPMLTRAELLELPNEGPPELIGDIVLALQTCATEATEKALSLQDHASHLLIHGFLHLAGYDHEADPQNARQMELLEIKALALLGIADPYGGLD